jgi:hypothetical protein
MFYRDECKHGQLSRSCELCEKEEEIKRLHQRVVDLERLAALYAEGNQYEAHRVTVALGLEEETTDE